MQQLVRLNVESTCIGRWRRILHFTLLLESLTLQHLSAKIKLLRDIWKNQLVREVRDYHASNNISIKQNHCNVLNTKAAITFNFGRKKIMAIWKFNANSIITTGISLRNFFCLSEYQGNRTGSFLSTVWTDWLYIFLLLIWLTLHDTWLFVPDTRVYVKRHRNMGITK